MSRPKLPDPRQYTFKIRLNNSEKEELVLFKEKTGSKTLSEAVRLAIQMGLKRKPYKKGGKQ